MKNRKQFNGPWGRTGSPVQVLILFLVLLAAPFASRAQYGTDMYDAIPMGGFYGYEYVSEYGNNYYYNGFYYQNNYNSTYYSNNAQPSPDVWYSFTVNSTLDLDVFFCGSGFDAYVHLLDQYGNELAFSSGPSGCGGLWYMNLTPGTYYLVVEGQGYATGDYDLSINTYLSWIPSPGANMGNAIDAGTLLAGSSPFSDTRSNADPMLGDDMGHPSNDIFYKFTLNATQEVDLSHCGSEIDTYMHLLNSSGLILASNDDNNIDHNLPCPGLQSHIRITLPAGTYYVVSEGYNTHAGWITTTIGIVPPPLQVPAISYPVLSGLEVGVPVSLTPTNSGGPVTSGQGMVSTFAGSGSIGAANGTGTAASFNQPAGGVFDAAGNLYIADIFNHRIRKITPAGVVSTFAGSGAVGSANGMGTAASFDKPYRLAMDAAGNLYVSGRGSNKIRKISPAGMVSTLAGSGVKGFADGPASTAAFDAPSGIAVDGSGNVYVSEQGNHRIRKITPSGVVSTLAGSGTTGSTNGTGGSARFNYPLGMAIDASGNLYVADYNNHKIRKVTLSGVVTTFAGSGSSGSADGPVGSATFKTPLDVAVDASGNVHITDANHKIRKISGGQVSTFAGTGQAGSVNGPYLSASFRMPHGLSFDSQGNLYVADTENHKVRRLGSSPAYSISPALPAGLTFNTSTGAISGTPTAVSAAQNYTVTASNAAGSSTVIISISISVAATPAQPNNNKNYIRTTTYREPFTVVPAAPSINDAMVEVAYFDGLGRPLQQVSVKASPDGQKDIVTPVSYDAFGRQDKNYLPYATATGAGGVYKEDAIGGQTWFYNSPPVGVVQINEDTEDLITPSFAQTVFEASPLNRILEQGAPGAAWQPAATRGSSGRTVLSEQATNNPTDFNSLSETRKVALYGVSLSPAGVPTLTLNGAYDANELYVSITKDENWLPADGRKGTVEEYTDKQGRVVLKRTFNEKNNLLEMLSTYYVYDDFGNLSFVLPPGISPDRDIGVPTSAELDHFAYRYRYDGRNRLVEKQLPGKGAEYIVYNKIDQVVATQDANQRANHQWLVSKYDGLGRNILTGIWDNGNTAISRDALQTLVNAQDPASLRETRISTGNGYSNLSWPTANITTTLTLQYYDSYEIPDLPTIYKPAGYSSMIKGFPTASKVNVLGTADMLWEVSHYDDKGQVVRQFNQHYKGGVVSEDNFDDLSNEYSFTGQLESSIRKHHAGSASIPAVTVTTEQTYDHMERPLDTWSTVDYGPHTLLARNGYNEIGQAISKKLHSEDGTSFGQQVNYAYNERGWLKETSSPLFSQQLNYNEGAAPQYNGNISSQVFTRYDLNQPTPLPVTDTYSYSYDKLDRLTQGVMGSGQGRETLTYDRMGNIQNLIRTGTDTTIVDQLSYSYSGNRLMGVTDAVAGGAGSEPYHLGGSTTYTYDDNGNLKSRVNTSNTGNNITDVVYNYLNLPQTVTAAGGTVSYTYDALGRKLQSINGIQGQTRDYIDGIEYENGSIELIHHSEGRIVRSGGDYHYEYYLKDHLGNSRSGFAAGTNVTAPNFSSDYYPFGMQYQEYIRTGNPKNNYLYNGKELQDGLKLYDYGARLYDPVTGRWGTMDPLAEVHHGYNPYNYVLNNPMLYMDPLGLDTLGVNSHDNVPTHAVEGDVLVDSEGTSSTLLRTVPITPNGPPVGNGTYVGGYGNNGGNRQNSANKEGGVSGGDDLYDFFNKTIGSVGAYNDIKGNIKHNDLYWKGKTTGKTYFKNPVAKATGWKANSFKASGKAFQGAKSLGSKLGAAGVLISVGDMAVNGVNTSNSLDLAFGAFGFIPGVGWAISGTYFIGNIATEMATGKNIGQHIDEF